MFLPMTVRRASGLGSWYTFRPRYSLLLTSMCCDDAYPVTPYVSALAGCDRLVSELGLDLQSRVTLAKAKSNPSEAHHRSSIWLSSVERVHEEDIPKTAFRKRDFDSEIRYHPRKANVVADALSEASKVENATAKMLRGMDQPIERKEDGGMYFIWVSLIGDVRTLIMDEAHASSNCLTCLKVNAETSKTFGFIATAREDFKMGKLARLYIDKIVTGHGVPVSIILDCNGRFTSRVLANITESLRDAIGYEYGLSSSDGWTKFNFGRTSLTRFPAQSVRSSNAYALDSPYLLVLITETSQSRQHDKSE
ncbi:hypothetical protein Tco_0869121 [Tanacetum coccineum]